VTHEYPGRVRRRTILVGTVLSLIVVAALIALTTWLRIEGRGVALPAPAEPDVAAPGALVCPDPSTLPSNRLVEITAGELIDCPDVFDGRGVIYSGEVIEAVFERGGRPVAVLNDDDYALGPGPLPQTRTALGGNSGMTVLLPAGFADQITHTGSYARRGDLVRVTGTFTAASGMLGGEPAIDASAAEITQPGEQITHRVSARTVLAALLAMATAGGATWLAQRDPDSRRHRRQSR